MKLHLKKGVFYRLMCWYDAWWRRQHKVEKFDELISFSLEPFTGERRQLNDGSWIEPGDTLAILHFNRECFSVDDEAENTSQNNPPVNKNSNYMRNALRFRKLIFASLAQLANDIHQHERLLQVKAFHGISWLPPHGEKFGFLIEKLPDTTLTRIRKYYFRLLLSAFFPQVAARESQRIEPHAYWLSRQNLLKYFLRESAQHES